VRLELASGRAVIIGSDDAEALQQAIDARRTAAVSRAKEGQMRERG
jgi:citrate lyase gamma subunit